MSPQLFREFCEKFQHYRILDFAKTLNVAFGAETERVKPSPPTSKEIGAVFVNTELCLLKVRAKLSPGVGVC